MSDERIEAVLSPARARQVLALLRERDALIQSARRQLVEIQAALSDLASLHAADAGLLEGPYNYERCGDELVLRVQAGRNTLDPA